jgi:hypothetical protein
LLFPVFPILTGQRVLESASENKKAASADTSCLSEKKGISQFFGVGCLKILKAHQKCPTRNILSKF